MSRVELIEEKLEQAALLSTQVLSNLGCAKVNLDAFLSEMNKELGEGGNGPLGKTRFVNCVKALAPVRDIVDCLDGDGQVLALVGSPNALDKAVLVRILECNVEFALAVPFRLAPGADWSSGNEMQIVNPAKNILRLALTPGGGA